uniref:Extended synaptotagmin 1 n=1 Tax=Scleropages formosus TaxID=113540 RepID=A0A8C9TYH3_SCLFO
MPGGDGGLDGGGDSTQPGEDAAERGEMLAPSARGADAVSVLWSFGKCLGALLPVYLAGYFGFSIIVVVLGLMVYMGWRQSRDGKESRLQSAMYVQENEQDFATSTSVFRSKRELPAWVRHTHGFIAGQAWPFVGQYLEKLLVETIAPSIRGSNNHLQTFTFSKVNLGSKPLRVVGVKAYTEHDKRQVLLDLYISYVGDVEINVEVKKYFCKAGVKGIQLHGKLRVILEPLIGDIPLVGAITMFFIRRPTLDINWTGLTNLLDIPGLKGCARNSALLSLPQGIVRIHLLEAESLVSKDNYGLITGKSDPYAVLRVGTQIFTSHHVENNLNPQWREMYEVIVHEVPGQELEVDVFDKDPDQDDFLGRMKLDLGLVKKARLLDEWFTLKDTAAGRIHLKLEWLSLKPTADQLNQVLQRNASMTISSKTDPPSSAILAIYLDRAQELPLKKGNKDPNPMVQLSVQDTTKESKTCYGTNSPQWEEAFTFFIQDPRKQDIDIQVKDDDRSLSLGSLSIPLSRLLTSPELTMDQWFQLDNSGPANTVAEIAGEGVNGSLSLVHSRPKKTSPDPSFATEGVLRIHLVKAQDLVAKDNFMGGMVKGKSDPYVKTRVGGVTFRSHVVKENLNPTWNELYEVILTQLPGQEVQVSDRSVSPRWDEAFSFLVHDPREDILTIKVKFGLSHNWGMALGNLVLPVKALLAEPGLELDCWLTLDGALPESEVLLKATLKVSTMSFEHEPEVPELSHNGHTLTHTVRSPLICLSSVADSAKSGWSQVKLTLRYSTEENRLVVIVHACRYLEACSKDGSDPYVSFILQPDKNKTTKRKTSIKKKDLNPEYNERFDFELSLEEARHRKLDLAVKNSVSFMSRERELIGKYNKMLTIHLFSLIIVFNMMSDMKTKFF